MADGPARTPVVPRDVVRADASGALASAEDRVAVEEPLEIRVAGDAIAVTMRTPGEDSALAVGFLFAEGVIRDRTDVGSVAHCTRPGDEDHGNAIDVRPGAGVALDVERSRRGTLTTAACGVCGRRSIDDLLARCRPLASEATIPWSLLRESTAHLARAQRHFAATGGLHAALVLDTYGTTLAFAEDVGRHNAVDKAIGRLVLDGVVGAPGARTNGAPHDGSASPLLLVVSGRISFEIVQKAVVAGIPCVAGVSAPTSLAVDLARATGLTLAGFVRDGSLNLYAHAERVSHEPPRPSTRADGRQSGP